MNPRAEPPVRSIGTDPAAFTQFYRAHVDDLTRFVARRVADPHQVADLTAQVFVAVIDAAPRYRGSFGGPRTWLYGIARNVLSAHWRRQARPTAHAGLSDDVDPWADTDTRLDATAQRATIGRILETLSQDEREVLLLVVWEQLTPAEVAAVLGLPQGTARSRLHRALTTLREATAHPPVLTCSDPMEA